MIKFGTGGWRAVIGDEFTRENIQKLAKALAMKMKDEDVDQKGLCIGYDRRFLSKEAVMWACEVFAAENITCWFVNRSSPTPLIMFYVMAHDLPDVYKRQGSDTGEDAECAICDRGCHSADRSWLCG